MGLFRRRAQTSERSGSAAAVTAFWAWWADARAKIDTAVEAGDCDVVSALVGPRVEQLHANLEWELRAGTSAPHLFVLSSAGMPELRPLTERWRRAGPADDDRWEFRPARPPDPAAFSSGAVITVEGVEVNLAGITARAKADDARCRLDVAVHHARFADMSEEGRAQLAFLALDLALGEDDVERWLGAVDAVPHEPLDRLPVALLGSVVDQLTRRWSADRWAVLEGAHGRTRLLAAIRHPVHRVDHPLFDEHVSVRLPYKDKVDDGLPGDLALGDLRAFTEALVDRLGRSALMVAHETTSGERLLHLYCDGAASVVPQIEAMLGAYAGGEASVWATPDPAWRLIEHLRP